MVSYIESQNKDCIFRIEKINDERYSVSINQYVDIYEGFNLYEDDVDGFFEYIDELSKHSKIDISYDEAGFRFIESVFDDSEGVKGQDEECMQKLMKMSTSALEELL